MERPAAALRLRANAPPKQAAVWRDDGLPWWGKPTETPAVFSLERSAKEMVHESCTADTRDHEDHTFCGTLLCYCSTGQGAK